MKNADYYLDKIYTWLSLKVPGILFALLVLVIGMWLIKLFSRWLKNGMHRRAVDPSLKPFFISLAITVLRILLVLIAMQIAGVQMTMFAALVGALGVAAGLALSGTLQNFASGVLILMLKPFRVGDNIIAQGQEGTVTSIQIFYTLVTTYDNRTVVIPNSKLSNEVIINITKIGSRRLDAELKFNYGVDFEQIKAVIEKTVSESSDTLKDPESRVGISLLEEGGYKVMISVWLSSHGYTDAKLRLQEALMLNLKQSGIKLPGMS